MTWHRLAGYVLDDGPIELRPQYGFPDFFYVVDSRHPNTPLTDALPLKTAKASGEYHAKRLAKAPEPSR